MNLVHGIQLIIWLLVSCNQSLSSLFSCSEEDLRADFDPLVTTVYYRVQLDLSMTFHIQHLRNQE
jgi:hypothetical protein